MKNGDESHGRIRKKSTKKQKILFTSRVLGPKLAIKTKHVRDFSREQITSSTQNPPFVKLMACGSWWCSVRLSGLTPPPGMPVSNKGFLGIPCTKTSWCSTLTLLLICSSFSRENDHLLLIWSSLSTAQKNVMSSWWWLLHPGFTGGG